MATLESYDREVHSIFQLLGEKENDITLSMSWALTKCPEFLNVIRQIKNVFDSHFILEHLKDVSCRQSVCFMPLGQIIYL